MEDAKVWYKSKTIISSLVTIFVGIAGLLGIAVAPEMQETIVNTLFALTTVITGVVAIYGRITAKTKVVK